MMDDWRQDMERIERRIEQQYSVMKWIVAALASGLISLAVNVIIRGDLFISTSHIGGAF